MPPNPDLPCADAPCLNPRLSGQTRCAAHHAARARERRAAQAAARSRAEAGELPLREPVTDALARARELAAQDGSAGVAGTRLLRDIERERAERGEAEGSELQAVMVRGFFFRGQDREDD